MAPEEAAVLDEVDGKVRLEAHVGLRNDWWRAGVTRTAQKMPKMIERGVVVAGDGLATSTRGLPEKTREDEGELQLPALRRR